MYKLVNNRQLNEYYTNTIKFIIDLENLHLDSLT